METNKNEKNAVISGLIWKFGERITAQVISLLVAIILARLLTPEDYGAVALVMVFITIANVFVTSGLGSSLVQKKDADNLDFSSVFYINIGISIVLYFLLYLIAPIVAEFYEMPVLTAVLRVLGIRIIVAAVNSVQHAYVSRHMLFKRFFFYGMFYDDKYFGFKANNENATNNYGIRYGYYYVDSDHIKKTVFS